MVSPSLQRLVKKKVPELHLHELPGEGHLSPFCHNDKGHRDMLSALFGMMHDRQHEVSHENANKALEKSSHTQAFEGDDDEIAKVEPLIRRVVETPLDCDTTAPSKQQESAELLHDAVKRTKLSCLICQKGMQELYWQVVSPLHLQGTTSSLIPV